MASPKPKAARHYSAAGQKAAALLKQEKKEIVLSDAQRTAIEAMVFEGLQRKEAAALAGITDEAMRQALLKPKALAYLNECMDVLRTGARPRALRKMVDLLEAKTERIQFESAKYLDGMDRPSHAVGAATVNVQVNNTVNVTPGYVLDLRPESGQQIEHLEAHVAKALDYNADVPEDE